ncbi:MAG: hypothetical protein Q4A62_04585 [Eikenella sp.]|nr:hypothetical protein [Eikenella sp.]
MCAQSVCTFRISPYRYEVGESGRYSDEMPEDDAVRMTVSRFYCYAP